MADLELEARQIHGGRRDMQMRDRGGENRLAQRSFAGDEIVGRDLPAFLVDAEPGRGIALRIEVDDEHALADGGERGAEIDRGRGLADAALLVGDRQHPRRRRGVRFRLARKRHDVPGIHIRRLLVIRHGVPSIPAGSPGPILQLRTERRWSPRTITMRLAGLVRLGASSAWMFQYLAASVNSASTS